jgi:lysophospholipase L1-like esterase
MLKTELAQNKYDLVVIFGGYNDNYAYGNPEGSNVSYKLNRTTSQLSEMYKLSKQNGSSVVAITPAASANNKRYNSYRQSYHNQLNDWIMKSDADYKIDLYSLETGGKNNTKPLSGMTGSDGEHLGAAAHSLLAKEIEKKIS